MTGRTRVDECPQYGSGAEAGLWGSVEYRCQPSQKVDSVGSNLRLLIALYSPSALLETGLHICLSEKRRDSHCLRYRAARLRMGSCDLTMARMSRFSKTKPWCSCVSRSTTSTIAQAKSSARTTWFGNNNRNTG